MKILHLSDLHLKNESSKSIEIFSKIINTLSNHNIDLVLFTGDLVDKFSYPLNKAFTFLNEQLIKPLNSKLFLCCGNHDINRNKILPLFESHIKDITNETTISDYIYQNIGNQFEITIEHIKEYNDLISTNYNSNCEDIKKLAFIHNLKIEDKLISIVSLNFSWTAFNNKTDYGKLWFSHHIIKEIISKIKNSNFKIILSHQPLSFLHESCRYKISNTIYENFDCVFNGHTHKDKISSHLNSSNGILNCISSSTFDSTNKEYPLGFLLLDINLDTYDCSTLKYEFITSEDNFILIKNEKLNIPINKEKKEKITIAKAISNKYETIIEEANKKFKPSNNINSDFVNLFTPPILKSEDSSTEITITNTEINKSKAINYLTLIDNKNSIIYGKDKSGKSSLLYRLLIHYLHDFSKNNIIPIYIDLKSFYNNSSIEFDIAKIVKSFYNFSNKKIENILNNYNIKLLLDNLEKNQVEFNNIIFDCINKYKNITATITCLKNYKIKYISDNNFNLIEYYLHDINRSKIRELTYKWPITNEYDKDEIVNKITKLFTQLNIHFNYWTVSLFLWIFEKTNNLNLHNNAELIDLYIENLLEKSNLILNSKNQTFSYENYKDFLGEFAYYLYNDKETSNYCASYSEIVICFEDFRKDNLRIIADPKIVLKYIFEKGIIVKESNDSYTFRLNGIFEYFLSHYLQKHPEFKKQIIKNSNEFLSFGNELEIFSGFNRNDSDLLIQIYSNCLDARKLLQDKFKPLENIDNEISIENNIIKELTTLSIELKDEITPLSDNERDSFEESISPLSNIESSVQIKEKYNISKIDINLYMKHLFILSRVFRNLDDIKDENLLKEVFNFIIEESCISIIYSLEELIQDLNENNIDLDDLDGFKDFMKSFSPIIAHTFLYDAVGHPTLKKLIIQKIDEIKNNSQKSEFILFILYFLILENNLESEIDLIDEIIDISNIWNIKHSIFIKIIMYISFKSSNKKALENKLKDKLEKIFTKLNPEFKKNRKEIINNILKDINIDKKIKKIN